MESRACQRAAFPLKPIGNYSIMTDLVQTSAIEKIEIEEEHEGVVFNLQTETEEYVVSGVVVHNCPHVWKISPGKVPQGECRDLWMGS